MQTAADAEQEELDVDLIELDDELQSEADELVEIQSHVTEHEVVWGAPTLLDMEDHLCRSELLIFVFLEARERADNYTADERHYREELASIPECPPAGHWKVEPARSCR